ncbi:MAG: hypothetical protein J6Y30_13345 [Treponema sp.]|nr:hypothetical protein [Treponema sp.]
MIEFLSVATKDTRAFGWVQDASNIDSLCDVVAVFDSKTEFHNRLVNEIIPSIVLKNDGRKEMIEALNANPLALKYRLLIGTSFTPRSASRCNGIIQAAVKGQKRAFVGDWPADNFVRWAHAVGFIKYNYSDDTFSITEKGLELTKANESEKENLLINAILSYPPAFRILSLLSNPDNPLTKFELGEKLGFTGEEGFICYPVRSIVAALAETSDKEERSKIRSDWESSSDKYARTIAQWLGHLGLVKTCKKEVTVKYGHQPYFESLGAFQITPKGERVLRNITGNSKHSKLEKIVSYEMFATKGSDREYLRLRRSLTLKAVVENKNKIAFSKLQDVLKINGLEESIETIKDDILGFVNLGLNVEVNADSIVLKDTVSDFSIPMYKDLTVKSKLSKEKDEVRKQLKTLPHDYLSLLDLAFDSAQNRLFEMRAMDLFLNECGFYGRHLGGANKPDGILYTDEPNDENYGIIVDMKAYSNGYNLPIGQQDEMKRYISNNQKRDDKINSTKWWVEFPDYLKKYYFMFVSGSFKGDIPEKLNKIYLETKVNGTAMPIVTALLVADKIKSKIMTLKEFENGICNTEYLY